MLLVPTHVVAMDHAVTKQHAHVIPDGEQFLIAQNVSS